MNPDITKPYDPMVAAIVAATGAQQAAWQAMLLGFAILGCVLILGLMIIYLLVEFKALAEHTNGMRQALVDTTRRLATVEGIAQGRADQLAEDTKK